MRTDCKRLAGLDFGRVMAQAAQLQRPGGVDESTRAGALTEVFLATRAATEALAEPLSPEDQQVQSMPDVSPTKWHLAHTSWFFEEFVLARFEPAWQRFHPQFAVLFNSYYESVGARHPRPQRGLLSRPSAAEIMDYRAAVTDATARLLHRTNQPEVAALVTLGIAHEEQHQELVLMDIKHVLSVNPLQPAYRPRVPAKTGNAAPVRWIAVEGGLRDIGHDGAGFAFDNEQPRHRVWLEPFRLASRLVTAGEYIAFMLDGGYASPTLWLSDGWAAVQAHGWQAPLYWQCDDGVWSRFTLAGRRPVDPAEPVSHVSFYEAYAFAKWAGRRLPTEAEWECAAHTATADGNFMEGGTLEPRPAALPTASGPAQMFGDLWEWTSSAYAPYPRFREPDGAIGEYNGKFMSGQMVLRGGAAITPRRHIRPTYRNFFPPAARWQFAGIRLAEDVR
jgi:ergothioneine biosynthesis protein EgtB